MTKGCGTGQAKRALALVVLVATCAFAGCQRSRPPNEERVVRARTGKGDVVLAAAWPWELRKEIRYLEGLQMAVDQVNAAGGVPGGRKLRLEQFDDRESIDEGRLVAQRITANPDIVAVIGHLQSYITVQVAGVYDAAGVVLMAPTATDPQLTARGYTRVFRATFTDAAVGRQLAEYAIAQNYKRVGIYYIRNDYGRNVANAFEARASQSGIAIATRAPYDASEQANERTFEAVLREWKSLDMDAILLAGEVPSAAIFVAQARKQGITVPILGGDAMSSPGLMAVAGPAAEGMVVASFFHPDDPRPEVGTFVKAFKQKYGKDPDAGSALGYDTVSVLAHAMHQAGSVVPDDVSRALHALQGYKAVTGAMGFDETGSMLDKVIVKSVVRSGRFEFLAAPAAR
jgi:branched-chain amino acid transport system substrate-binding protein